MVVALPVAGTAGDGGVEDGVIRGRVTGGEGLAVEHARVTAVGSGRAVFTDSHGLFVVSGCSLPCSLVVSHPRFVDSTVEVDGAGGGRLEIALRRSNRCSSTWT